MTVGTAEEKKLKRWLFFFFKYRTRDSRSDTKTANVVVKISNDIPIWENRLRRNTKGKDIEEIVRKAGENTIVTLPRADKFKKKIFTLCK